MRILDLQLTNIGPFDEAHLDFRREEGSDEVVPITILTGENGTGKSILLDAIRALFGPHYGELRRPIQREKLPFHAEANLWTKRPINLRSHQLATKHFAPGHGGHGNLSVLPLAVENGTPLHHLYPAWIVDYWAPSLSNDSFQIQTFSAPNHRLFLKNALSGTSKNADTTSLICHFDYLRDSRDPAEAKLGELLWSATQRIVAASIDNGTLEHVARSRYEPMFRHHGQLIGIEKLSAGSLYLIQRMLGLLGRMYSCHVASEREGDDLLDIPGLLLIDEAENHLHPKWQKRFLPTIHEVFPNLQIIVATHSPFIVSSVEGARVYVCEAHPENCTVRDVSDRYANRSVDEILLSPAFAATQPFNEEITKLLAQRRAAIEAGDEETRQEKEAALRALNPEAFDYFGVEELLARVAGRRAG